MTSLLLRNLRTTAPWIRHPRTVCSLAAAALVAAVPAVAQQPYGAGVRTAAQPRPVPTYNTPYPTTTTPGPQPVEDPAPIVQPPTPRVDSNVVQAGYRPSAGPRPAPGAAGKVMYFHKQEGALVPDGAPDAGATAMATNPVPPTVATGVTDVTFAAPGALPPAAAPTTAIDRPITEAGYEPTLPPQPFIPTPVPGAVQPYVPAPTTPTAALPVPPRVLPTPGYPGGMKESPEVAPLPPRSVIFMMYDDAALQKAILKSIGERLNRPPETLLPFPDLKPIVPPGTPYVAKTTTLPPSQMLVEPGFVIHHRLHFEEKNSERYGWDLGFIQPFVSTLAFYKNVLLWPSSLASGLVTGFWDTNMGKCLPGSPTPYYLYPQGLTITGGVAEGLVITGLTFVIP